MTVGLVYHTLHVGYRTRIGGETDFPCVSGDRVGMGRSYVKLDGRRDYTAWCKGLRRGRVALGEHGSELRLAGVNPMILDRRRFFQRFANAIPDGPDLPLVPNVDPHPLIAQVGASSPPPSLSAPRLVLKTCKPWERRSHSRDPPRPWQRPKRSSAGSTAPVSSTCISIRKCG
jgi:hypothetical protein